MIKVNTSQCEFLVESNIKLVIKIASRFSVSAFDREDLIQAGLYGLYKAARRYDVSKGNKFSTYAVYYIIGAMKDELKKFSLLKNKEELILKEDLNEIKSNYLNLDRFDFTEIEKQILMLRLSYGYTQKEIALQLKLSQSTVSRMFKTLKNKIQINKNSI